MKVDFIQNYSVSKNLAAQHFSGNQNPQAAMTILKHYKPESSSQLLGVENGNILSGIKQLTKNIQKSSEVI